MAAKDILANHAAEFGLGESAQIDLLCNFIDQLPDAGFVQQQLQHFVDIHADELEGDGGEADGPEYGAGQFE